MTEMNKLVKKLAKADIPFEIRAISIPNNTNSVISEEPSIQICFPSLMKVEMDVVSHNFSYGGEQGLIEILGDPTIIGTEDGVKGWLTADDAYEYFYKANEQRLAKVENGDEQK